MDILFYYLTACIVFWTGYYFLAPEVPGETPRSLEEFFAGLFLFPLCLPAAVIIWLFSSKN